MSLSSTDMAQYVEGKQQHQQQHGEGVVARAIEQQTAKIPSDVFMWAAYGAMGASLICKLKGHEHNALFIGQWVPTLLIFGLYNKIVKVAGSDRTHR